MSNLSSHLKAAGLKTKDLAAALDCAEVTVRQWAAGLRRPHWRTAQRIAAILGCEVRDLGFAMVDPDPTETWRLRRGELQRRVSEARAVLAQAQKDLATHGATHGF